MPGPYAWRCRAGQGSPSWLIRAVIGFLLGLVLFLMLDLRRGSRVANSRLDTSNDDVDRAQVLQAECRRMAVENDMLICCISIPKTSDCCYPVSSASYASMQEIIRRFHHAKAYVKGMKSSISRMCFRTIELNVRQMLCAVQLLLAGP